MKWNAEKKVLYPKWNADLKIICRVCRQKPALIKRNRLCQRCYQRGLNKNPTTEDYLRRQTKAFHILKEWEHKAEVVFGQSHPEFVYQPCTFDLNYTKYTPDFYDASFNVFYEIIGTRQRFEQLKEKIKTFRELFPQIKLEICLRDGSPYHSTKNQEIVGFDQNAFQLS